MPESQTSRVLAMPFLSIDSLTPEARVALLDALRKRAGDNPPRWTVAPNGWETYHPDRDPLDLDRIEPFPSIKGASPIGR